MSDSLDGPSTELIGTAVFILLGAIYAAVDEALVACGAPRLRAAREGDDADARAAARFLAHEPVIQARYLAGRVVCLATAAALASQFAFERFGGWGVLVAVAGVAMCYALAVDLSTTVTARRASRMALPLSRYARPLEFLMAPVAFPLVWLNRFINRLYPPRPEDDPEQITEAVVEHIIEQGEELGSLRGDQAELLHNVLEFTDTVAREVMVPRTSMVAINIDAPVSDVLKLVVEKGHSRYPVYRGRVDQVEGVLYAKDLFRVVRRRADGDGRLSDLVRRNVLFTAESQKISGLLRQMQLRRVHLAIVVDEFGGTSGMVTLEDIIEEIVGEIHDEHDQEELPVRKLSPGRYLANAKVSVYDLAELTGIEIPVGARDCDSLGGLVVELVGRVPSRGEMVRVGQYQLIVRDADERHVTRIEVRTRDMPSAAE